MILDLASRDGSLMLRTEIIQILIKMVLFIIFYLQNSVWPAEIGARGGKRK